MKLKQDFAGIAGALCIASLAPFAADAQTNSVSAEPATRYGLFNGLDHGSTYGQAFFPEPFLVDESDLDNEIRLDWVHTKARSKTGNIATTELEKSFGMTTVEAEFHYEHDVEAGRVTEGIANIDVGARRPFYEVVSANGFADTTVGAGLEVGIPVHSSVSRNAELVPKLFNDLRLGNFTVQTIAGYSTLFGSGKDGGLQTFEYGLDFGYSFSHERLPVPHVQQIVPLIELSGETDLNRDTPGRNSLTGVAGLRVNCESIGPFQPRLGLGFIFPVNSNARGDVHWGLATSLVFEY